MSNSNLSLFERYLKITLFIFFIFSIIVIGFFLKFYFYIAKSILNDKSNYEIDEIYDRDNKYVHHDYFPNVEFVKYPNNGDSFSPVKNIINSMGIRGLEISSKQHYRVLNIGDSFIQATSVEFKNTFGELLNEYFNGEIEFISHGMSSWSPTTEFSWIYHKGLKLDPNEINLFLCINDFYRGNVYGMTDMNYRKQAVYDIDCNYVPVTYTQDSTLLKKRGPIADEIILLSKDYTQWPNSLKYNVDETINVIFSISKYLNERNIEIYVLLIPLGFRWKNETIVGKQTDCYGWKPEFTVNQDGLNNYLKKKLNENNVNYIDLYSNFDNFKIYNPNCILYNEADGHLNKNGHILLYNIFRNYYEKK